MKQNRGIAILTGTRMLFASVMAYGGQVKLRLERSPDLKTWEAVPLELEMLGAGGELVEETG